MIEPAERPQQDPSLGLVDRLTQAAAGAISRRSLFKSFLIGGMSAAIGVPLFNPILAAAGSCNSRYAPCGYCKSETGRVYSPNGAYWRTGTCTCNSNCDCCCFHAYLTVCNDGGYAVSCPTCCVACFPCC
jgi:hypothetical protein